MKNIIIKRGNRYLAEHSWLKSYHLFSFAEYFDPLNLNFGNLRVFNDDYIDAGTGFGLHPHSNMEILTIPLVGELTHGDSIGNKETIREGEVQTMTAGSGIFHSEENLGEKDVHSYQIWFLTNKENHKPDYKSHKINIEKNKLNLLVSGNKEDNVGFLNSSIQVFRSIYEKGNKFEYEINENRGLFLYLREGKIKVGDKIIEKEDQIRYSEIGKYDFEILEKSEFILIDVEI